MAGLSNLFELFFFICCVCFINSSRIEDISRVNDVHQETKTIDNVAYNSTTAVSASRETDFKSKLLDLARIGNYGIAGGMVSIDCMRCLCLKQSNCLPIGCKMIRGSLGCGYFFLSHSYWLDCGKLGHDWRSCSNDLTCSSQCVQKYMERYARRFSCFLNCSGYSRELKGGPNGCNNPRTVAYWEAVQKVPGCKGVE
ncbi:invertebrate-type lysozyme-like [Mercenaria mercenaria]|uniref:invertebrate-type lysozyme-like n=1 Tax=Mercenaria mercenaria TaxID=6596 RepID=UPI00234EA12C|nr:invertebrate-type lysozyme-like [Mercenaria mercenaria]